MTISLKADSSGTFGEVLVNGSPALKVSNGLLELPDGKDFFNQGNIVGTVSQSGGIPTGAVVERGSNANGEYVRFADGTQICRWYITFGSIGIASSLSASRTFPAEFVVTPQTIVSVGAGSYAEFVISSASTSSATGFTAWVRNVHSTATPSGVNVHWMSIGRWF